MTTLMFPSLPFFIGIILGAIVFAASADWKLIELQKIIAGFIICASSVYNVILSMIWFGFLWTVFGFLCYFALGFTFAVYTWNKFKEEIIQLPAYPLNGPTRRYYIKKKKLEFIFTQTLFWPSSILSIFFRDKIVQLTSSTWSWVKKTTRSFFPED